MQHRVLYIYEQQHSWISFEDDIKNSGADPTRPQNPTILKVHETYLGNFLKFLQFLLSKFFYKMWIFHNALKALFQEKKITMISFFKIK